jgi:hypothetical protein
MSDGNGAKSNSPVVKECPPTRERIRESENLMTQRGTAHAKKTGQAIGKGTPAPGMTNTLVISDEGKPRSQLLAELGLLSAVPNANTARAFAKASMGDLDLTESVGVVRRAANSVQKGDLSGLEATLAAQVIALDSIFNEMARRAALNMGGYLNATETYLRLGLKAQTQCRATIQTLFEMKNPQPVAFVKQANIAHGPQQVNNGVPTADAVRAGNSSKQSNELLGLNHEQRLDAGTASASGGTHPQLETVGTVHRPED